MSLYDQHLEAQAKFLNGQFVIDPFTLIVNDDFFTLNHKPSFKYELENDIFLRERLVQGTGIRDEIIAGLEKKEPYNFEDISLLSESNPYRQAYAKMKYKQEGEAELGIELKKKKQEKEEQKEARTEQDKLMRYLETRETREPWKPPEINDNASVLISDIEEKMSEERFKNKDYRVQYVYKNIYDPSVPSEDALESYRNYKKETEVENIE